MKKILFLLAATAIICACEKKETVNYNGSDQRTEQTTDTTSTDPKPSWSKMYIKGFKLYDVYSANYYFKFECIGYGLVNNTQELYLMTDYTDAKITREDLPYTYMLPTPIEVGEYPNPLDWYTTFDVGVYFAANTSASGVATIYQSVNAYKLENKTEYIFIEEKNGGKVGILFTYK